jgi:hypothetical protein
MRLDHALFLRQLHEWGGIASLGDLGSRPTREESLARQFCKRRGWVVYNRCGRGGYWMVTSRGAEMMGAAFTTGK